jgi:tRNA nucleotidyltransferase (CCA-adding enzyme)
MEIASQALKRLKVDKNTYFNALKLIELHDKVIKEDKPSVKQALREIGERNFLNLLKVQTADALAHTVKASNIRRAHIRKIRELYREIKRNNECYSLKNLAVNGEDIKAWGYSGEKVGELLNKLLDAVIQGEKNQKNTLKEIAING